MISATKTQRHKGHEEKPVKVKQNNLCAFVANDIIQTLPKLILAALCLSVAACAATPPAKDAGKAGAAAPVRPALAATATFDARGRLWLATVRAGHVYVSRSDDKGKSFHAAVAANTAPEKIAADGENRPKIAVGRDGAIYVSWTQGLDQPFSGHVRLARSVDSGKTFSTPVTVNDNLETISHRFESLILDGFGRARLVWLDKREQHAAKRRGEDYRGAAVYAATAADGMRFHANDALAAHSCECCRIALALDNDGVPVILWRHIYDKNTRDHALLRLDGRSAPVRATHDEWQVDACPHHGPALSIGSDGIYHLAWFTGAATHAGLYYRQSRDRGKTFTAPLAFGDAAALPAHPQVQSLGPRVFLAWKEFDGAVTTVQGMRSRDGGRTWSKPQALARAAGASDHPLLISDGRRAYLSWNTLQAGYRVLEIPDPAASP